MFRVELRFNSVDRVRMMPVVPRMGDIVDFDDDGENVVLKVNRVVMIESDGSWSFHCNCSVQDNWID